MTSPTVIDADRHVQEKYIRWEDYLEEPHRSRAPRVVKDNRMVDFLMVEGNSGPSPPGQGSATSARATAAAPSPPPVWKTRCSGSRTWTWKGSTPRCCSTQMGVDSFLYA